MMGAKSIWAYTFLNVELRVFIAYMLWGRSAFEYIHVEHLYSCRRCRVDGNTNVSILVGIVISHGVI